MLIADSDLAERRGADYGAVGTGRNYTRPISVPESDPLEFESLEAARKK
jgi:hypothetical protein